MRFFIKLGTDNDTLEEPETPDTPPTGNAPLHRGAATEIEEIHQYIYAGGKLLRETISDGTMTKTLDFTYDNVGMPYSLIYNNGTTTATYYYITNLQGDVMYLVDANGVQVAAYDYDPYGKIISATGDLAEINPLRYRGYYYDTETSFYYLQSRYYDPEICRFINADSYASTGDGFTGYNMFAYCNNSPVLHSDPSGEILVTTVILIVSAAVGVTVAAVTAYESRKAGCDWADTAVYSLANGVCAFAAVYTLGLTAYNAYINICTLAGRTPVTEINLGGSNPSDIDISSRLQACADKANASVYGRGPQVGTQKHTIFAEEVNALGNNSLRTEVSYKNGVEVPYGTAGSTRFDVMQFDEFGNPFRAWDFKTGAAILSPQRITNMQSLSGLYSLRIDMIK